MELTNRLISEFVKITNDEVKKEKNTQIYGNAKIINGLYYVVLDGSEILTPCDSTIEVNNGDRVLVDIKNHTATVNGVVKISGGQSVGSINIIEE